MIVACDHEHASVPGNAIGVAVPQRIAGAIESRTFAVPEREYPFDLALGVRGDALASERGGGGELLVDRRHEAHAMDVQQRFRLPHREVDAAERRAAITGDESGGVPAARAVEARLHQDEADQGLCAGDQDPAAIRRQVIVQSIVEQPPRRGGRRLEPLPVGCAHVG